MKDREFLEADPAGLHVPGSRRDGADPYKLHRQIAKYGTSIAGMPPIEVSRGIDGKLVINNSVTRATRAARCLPGTLVPVEVIDTMSIPGGQFPTIGDFVMTSETIREELLSVLAELGRLFPDWRLGQTLANLAMAAGHPESGAVWDLEDSAALAAARRLIEQNARRRQAKEPNSSLG